MWWPPSSNLVLYSSRGIAGGRGYGPAHGQVASGDDCDQTALQGAAVEHYVAVAGLTAQADVGAEPIDEPVLTAARVGAAQSNDIAEKKLHHLRGIC
jgi:hypothetical protein